MLHVDATSPGNALVLAKEAMDALLTSIEDENEGTQQHHRRHGGASSSSSLHRYNQLKGDARRALSECVSTLREMGGAVPDELGDEPGRPVVTMSSIDEEESQHNNNQHPTIFHDYLFR